ncbi:MAG: DUF11 domain-containing protein [Anaerolineae bacterium]|nr:DUF11 domain-containing protein [Anaerolineae bacterium]
MNNKTTTPHCQPTNKWIRFSLSLALAFGLALVLLFIPLAGATTKSTPAMPLFHLNTLPFGVALVQAQGGVTITKVAEPAAVMPGGTITYTLTFTNQTGGSLSYPAMVVVSETIPAHTTINCGVVQKPDDRWSEPNCGENGVWWGLTTGSIEDGESVDFVVAVEVDDPLPPVSAIINDAYLVNYNAVSTFGPPVTTPVIAPAWQITKTVPSFITEPGRRITYTLTITNNGTAATTGSYTITEQLPNDTYYIAGSASPAANFDGDSLTWVLPPPTYTVAAGASRSVLFVVTTTSILTDNFLIVNENYHVSGGGVYTATTPGQPVTVTVNSDVTLAISKIASSNVITVNYPLTYTLTVTNTSANGPALNVVITDTLPAFATYQSAGFVGSVPGSVITNGGNPIVWELDDPLPPYASAQMTVTVRVSSTLPSPPTLTNNYQTSADNGALVSGSLDVTVQPQEPTTLTVVAASTSLKICETTVITTTLIDNLNNPVAGENVSLYLIGSPSSATIVPDSGTTNQDGILISALQAITTGTPRIVGEWPPGIATVTNYPPGLQIQITTPPVPASLSLNASPSPLAAGGATAVVTATLDYCRADLKAGRLITLTLSDSNLATFSSPTSGLTDSSGNFTATLTSQTLSGTLVLTATGEGLTQNITLPVHTPVLTITKTALPAPQVAAGGALTYTVRVDNIGDVDAFNLGLTDTLPVSVNFVSLISATNSLLQGDLSGPTQDGQKVTVTKSKLEPSKSLTVTLYVTVTATLSGTTIENEATAQSSISGLIASNVVSHTVITATASTGNEVYLPIIIKGVSP